MLTRCTAANAAACCCMSWDQEAWATCAISAVGPGGWTQGPSCAARDGSCWCRSRATVPSCGEAVGAVRVGCGAGEDPGAGAPSARCCCCCCCCCVASRGTIACGARGTDPLLQSEEDDRADPEPGVGSGGLRAVGPLGAAVSRAMGAAPPPGHSSPRLLQACKGSPGQAVWAMHAGSTP